MSEPAPLACAQIGVEATRGPVFAHSQHPPDPLHSWWQGSTSVQGQQSPFNHGKADRRTGFVASRLSATSWPGAACAHGPGRSGWAHPRPGRG